LGNRKAPFNNPLPLLRSQLTIASAMFLLGARGRIMNFKLSDRELATVLAALLATEPG
jgi:hypothetical protein